MMQVLYCACANTAVCASIKSGAEKSPRHSYRSEDMARQRQGPAVTLVFVALFYNVVAQCNSGGVDQTLEQQATGEAVVTATANKINIFDDDRGFLRRMAKVESDNGMETGPGGIWRVSNSIYMTVNAHISLQSDQPTLQTLFENTFCISWSADVSPRGYDAMDVPLYSALTVMVYLSTVGEDIPETIQEQADLWNKFFNNNGDREVFITRSRMLRGS